MSALSTILMVHAELEKAMDLGRITFVPAPAEKEDVPEFKIMFADPTIRSEKVEGEAIDWAVSNEYFTSPGNELELTKL